MGPAPLYTRLAPETEVLNRVKGWKTKDMAIVPTFALNQQTMIKTALSPTACGMFPVDESVTSHPWVGRICSDSGGFVTLMQSGRVETHSHGLGHTHF